MYFDIRGTKLPLGLVTEKVMDTEGGADMTDDQGVLGPDASQAFSAGKAELYT